MESGTHEIRKLQLIHLRNLRIDPANLDFLVTCHFSLATCPDIIFFVFVRNRSAFRISHFAFREGFTLLELLVVIAIISVLLVAVIPAVTSIKSGNDITFGAYTVKGVLEQARTYAKANNTYSWIGFYEEDGSKASTNPASSGNGRLIMSIVASRDGTTIYRSGTPGAIDPTKLIQIGKLVKIENTHLPLLNVGAGAGDTFDTRPIPDWDSFNGYNDARFGELNATPPNTAPNTNSQFPFQYPVGSPATTAQYTFQKTLQFSPTGECRINSTYNVRRVVEIGIVQTHASATPIPSSGVGTSLVVFNGNVAAVQVSGFGSNVKIYRR
jgi:prepilin-type N-terminal cleavage/methylation domain-containing protein